MSESRTPGREESNEPSTEWRPRKPSQSEIRAELERILASRCFQQAGRASDFLRFVVEETLAGSGQRLKGYTIGVEVFGRPADFDAQSDALVRVEAGRLRRRLVEYYAGEGAGSRVRIELPRGSYAVDCRVAFADEPGASGAEPAATSASPPPTRSSLPWGRTAPALLALLLVAGGVIVWQQAALRDAGRALEALETREEPLRSEWPRLVVVPIENLTDEASLAALAAGLTEEILVRMGGLDVFIVASRASWYGERPSHERSLVAAAAGGYVLTGSVRGSSSQARIALRLIEAETGKQLWTAAYDEPLDRPRALEQRLARDVASIAAPYGPIFEAELAQARRAADAPKLRDCFAMYHEYRRRISREAYTGALNCYQRLTEQRPNVAEVWSGLAMLYVDEYAASFGRTGSEALSSARAATAQALALDSNDFLGSLALSRVQFYDGDPAFRQSIDRSLALRPGSVQALTQGGFMLAVTGDSTKGLLLTQKARALSKASPVLHNLTYAFAYLRERRFAEALVAAQRVNAHNWVVAQAVTAAAAAHAGRDDVALAAAARLRELYPDFEADALAGLEAWHFDPELYEVFVSGLRAAGLDLKERSVSGNSG